MTEQIMDRIENQLCARLLANALALTVAAARLRVEVERAAGRLDEERQDDERWDSAFDLNRY